MSAQAAPVAPAAAYTNNQCNKGCISRTKLNLLKSTLGAVSGTQVEIIKKIVEPIISKLEKRVITRVGSSNYLMGQFFDKELLEFSDNERETLKSNLTTLESSLNNTEVIINECIEKKNKLLYDLGIILRDLNKDITNLSKDKSDKMRIFNEFQKKYNDYNDKYPTLSANQIQQYELGSFLYKDPTFSTRFKVTKNGENIDITDTTNNVEYLMLNDGGIQKFEKDKGKFEDYIYFIKNHEIGFRKFELYTDRKISRLSQNDLLDFLPTGLQKKLPKIEEVQRKELAAFLNYDTNFLDNYTIAKDEHTGEITFTEIKQPNNVYIMRTDGGIVKMNGSNAVNYIYDISDTNKNIKFREASIWRDGTNRLLQNRQGLWGGKTKKRRKNKRKRRKTRRK